MSSTYKEQTIFALSTPSGRAALAVVRLSGAACDSVLRAMGVETLPPPRMASLRRLRDGQGRLMDEALILRFVAPHSFTGEDMVELHLHGGAATVEAVL
ncbi:MAG: tRNA uridine-5-carboxymethylaminomethyl(34) synthesis GTPase MnmE, partial [Alphaproteobacteria bacterium]|nr:tRNA uridine-5-carboxymethylaminomethyl(34) synthesis GTPase MnmE [Alphaproteobacteria bacterium]